MLLAGHLDTVPVADNVPSRRAGDLLHGCGTSDMKSGDAVLLHLAATLTDPVVRPDVRPLRQRGGRGREERPRDAGARAPRPAARRPGDPHGAHQRPGRGRLPRHPAGRGRLVREARRTAPAAGSGTTRSTPQHPCCRPCRSTGPGRRHRRLRLPRGPAGRGHRGRSRRQRRPRCVQRDVNFRFAPDRSEEQALDHVREVFDGLRASCAPTSAAGPCRG